jgi:hypothetical protein
MSGRNTHRRYLGRRSRNPLLDDVVQGRGGIAGGKFTLGQGDTLDVTAAHYVVPGYISGQSAYVESP